MHLFPVVLPLKQAPGHRTLCPEKRTLTIGEAEGILLPKAAMIPLQVKSFLDKGQQTLDIGRRKGAHQRQDGYVKDTTIDKLTTAYRQDDIAVKDSAPVGYHPAGAFFTPLRRDFIL
jgi:hypothetical protein